MQRTRFSEAVFRKTVLTTMTLAMAGLVADRPARGQDSPIAALETMNRTILEAESIDDILQFIPEEAHEFINQLPPEHQTAALEEEKARVGREKYVAERVDGDRAVVVAEKTYGSSPKGVRFKRMSRVDGAWKITDEDEYLVEALVGASGSYSAGALGDSGGST